MTVLSHPALLSVVLPADVQHWSLHGLLGLGDRFALGVNLPAPHVVVPGSSHEEVLGKCGGGEGEGRDAVVGRVGNLHVIVRVRNCRGRRVVAEIPATKTIRLAECSTFKIVQQPG